MAKFVVVCVLLSFVAVAYSELQCYNCLTNECDLAKPENQVKCGKGKTSTGADGEPACLKFVFKEKSGLKNVTRRCVIVDPKDKNPFKCTLPAGATEEFCETCKENLCNSADAMKFNFYNMLLATCSALLLKFLL